MTSTNSTPEKMALANTQKVISRVIRFGVLVNVAFGFAYLIMLNGLATQGFDLETLKAEQMTLHRQIELVDIALAIPSSIYALESNELIQEMPKVAQKEFLEIRNAEVAIIGSVKN